MISRRALRGSAFKVAVVSRTREEVRLKCEGRRGATAATWALARPLEVEAADAAVDISISPTRNNPGHTRDVSSTDRFFERDTAGGHLGVGSARSDGWRRPADQRMHEPPPLVAGEVASTVVPSIASLREWPRQPTPAQSWRAPLERRQSDARRPCGPTRIDLVELLTGQKLKVNDAARPSSRGASQCRDTFRARGPLIPKCVHNNAPLNRTAAAPSIHTVSSPSCATPDNSLCSESRSSPRTSGTRPGVVGTMV